MQVSDQMMSKYTVWLWSEELLGHAQVPHLALTLRVERRRQPLLLCAPGHQVLSAGLRDSGLVREATPRRLKRNGGFLPRRLQLRLTLLQSATVAASVCVSSMMFVSTVRQRV